MVFDNNGANAVAQAFEDLENTTPEEFNEAVSATIQLMCEFLQREKPYVTYAEPRGQAHLAVNIDLSGYPLDDDHEAAERGAKACADAFTSTGIGIRKYLGMNQRPVGVTGVEVLPNDQAIAVLHVKVSELGY